MEDKGWDNKNALRIEGKKKLASRENETTKSYFQAESKNSAPNSKKTYHS